MTLTKITEKVYMIDTLALGQPGTVAVYVLKGEKTALVDCGYASSYPNVLRGLSDLGVAPSDVDYIIPTHVHLDHAGAAGYLLREMPKAKVLAQEKGVPHLVDPTRLILSATNIFGDDAIKAYGIPLGIDKERVTGIGEEMHLDLGGGLTITAVHSPGHAPHQVSVLVEEQKLLLSADAVGIVYPSVNTMIPTTPPPSLEPAKLTDSIGKLKQMGSSKLLVPHYGVRDDAASVLEATASKTDAWLKRVRELKGSDTPLGAMTEEFEVMVMREAGIPEGRLPSYATLSIRITLMGMLHYLERSG